MVCQECGRGTFTIALSTREGMEASQVGAHVLLVLEDADHQNDVETRLGPERVEVDLDEPAAVGDTPLPGPLPGEPEHGGREVDPDDVRPALSDRYRVTPGAAADIEHVLAGQIAELGQRQLERPPEPPVDPGLQRAAETRRGVVQPIERLRPRVEVLTYTGIRGHA